MDIEEDLKILNEYINIDRKMRNNNQESDYDKFCERQCIAIENLLAEREEDKKKIAELEAKLEFYQWGDLDNLKFEEYMKEFMPKQKVKDILLKYKYVSINDTEGIVQFYQEFKKIVEDK